MNRMRTPQGVCVGLLSAASLLSLTCLVQAQDKPHKSLIKRHPTASAAVAGVAAHHYAKTRKSGIMRRHPIAVSGWNWTVTHHYAKK